MINLIEIDKIRNYEALMRVRYEREIALDALVGKYAYKPVSYTHLDVYKRQG